MRRVVQVTHAEVEAICLGYPGVTMDIKWKTERVFSIGSKMFCVCCADPDQSPGLSFKVEPARFLELTDQPGIKPAPYLARYHWVRLDSPAVLPAEQLSKLLYQAYLLVRAKLPKKRRDALPAL
ncbi:MmcQ/YjbR family DNA-binding protein [Chitinimonas sp. PSY-7]|uniref:MmcQ/YjbR family DNA-binding protein n=1 Tax=Chitinimonas sp. PSY-7 TaxID=3459088 RepID=UPI00403FCAE5